jgi:hypothetical protein
MTSSGVSVKSSFSLLFSVFVFEEDVKDMKEPILFVIDFGDLRKSILCAYYIWINPVLLLVFFRLFL